jgi:Transglycosylase SLT domain
MKVERARMDIATDTISPMIIVLSQTRAAAGFDPCALLRAIADVESTYGLNSNPRHEPAYCRGGKYFDGLVTKMYGCAAHCSYGPWQIMFQTALELGFVGAPEELANPETNAVYCVRYLKSRAREATSIEQIARCYNGGNITAEIPQAYIDKLTAAYALREAL